MNKCVGLSEEPVVQREKEVVGSGGGSTWEVAVVAEERRKKQRRRSRMKQHGDENEEGEDEEGEDDDEGNNNSGGGCGGGGGGGCERQREHPFIVTEPGEVARGKKNGLDYLFHLYEQCREFLIQVQAIAKDRGEKCPTKVTNMLCTFLSFSVLVCCLLLLSVSTCLLTVTRFTQHVTSQGLS